MGKTVRSDELLKALSNSLQSLQQKAKSVAAGSVLPNLTVTALAESAAIKTLHTHLQYAAQSTRAGALPAKQANASAVLELENARYESRALERELEQCAAVPTPNLDTLGLDLPALDTPEAHEATVKLLESELDRRVELTNRVVALRKERDERAQRVRKAGGGRSSRSLSVCVASRRRQSRSASSSSVIRALGLRLPRARQHDPRISD